MFRSKNRPITCPDSRSLITFNRSSIPLLDVTTMKLSTLRLESMYEQLDRETINKEAYTRTPSILVSKACLTFSHRIARDELPRYLSNDLFELSPSTTWHLIVDYKLETPRSINTNLLFDLRVKFDVSNGYNKRDTVSIKSDFLQSLFNLLVPFIE